MMNDNQKPPADGPVIGQPDGAPGPDAAGAAPHAPGPDATGAAPYAPGGYAYGQGAPALNPYYVPRAKPVRTPYTFAPGDAVYACFTLVLGFLFWELQLASNLGGFTILMAALIGSAVYLNARGVRQGRRSILVFSVCVLGALPLLLYDAVPIDFLLIAMVLCSCFYWVAVSAGTSVEERVSGFVLTDWANQTFIVPFSNFPGLFLSIRAASKDTKRGKSVLIGIVGLCIAIPLIIGVTSLLIRADAGFEKFANDFSDWIGLDDVGLYILKFIGGVPIACYVFGAVYGNAQKRYTEVLTKEGAEKTLAAARRIPRAAILTPLAVLCVLYIVFITVMSVYLFSAFADKLPEGLAVYANYARSGFFELCGVAAINLFVLIFTYCFARLDPADGARPEAGEYPRIMRFLAGLLCVMTELLVVTAVSKMLLYIDAYGLSRLRIFVLWFLILLLIVFAILIVWHIRPRLHRNGSKQKLNAGRPIVIVSVIMVILLGLSNTDGIIAKYNVWQFQNGKSRAPDTYMLGGMSDAVLPYLSMLRDDAPNYSVSLKARDAINRIKNSRERDLQNDGKNAFRKWSVQAALTKTYLPVDQGPPDTGEYITINEVRYSTSLTELDLSSRYLSNEDIAPLEYMTGLKDLYLDGNMITDLTPLAGLTNLRGLTLSGNSISDLTPLAGLTNLTGLTLNGNNISDLTPLAGLTNLTSLALGGNKIDDLTPLAGLTKLTWLSLGNNALGDLTPLAGLTGLTDLALGGNRISDLEPLSGLTNLNDLSLSGNQISDVRPLSGLANLTWLDLDRNQISDLAPLGSLTGLSYVNLEHNEIGDWSPAKYIRNVQGSP